MKPEFAWAAIALQGIPRPFLLNSSVRATRAEVQEFIGSVWSYEGETIQQGWRRAYRRGWRAVRVVVEVSNEA